MLSVVLVVVVVVVVVVAGYYYYPGPIGSTTGDAGRALLSSGLGSATGAVPPLMHSSHCLHH